MVSLWCEFLLTNTRFHFLYFRVNNCYMCICWYVKKKSFQTTLGGFYVLISLPIKSKMTAAKKQCFFLFVCLFVFSFSVLNSVFTYLPSFKVRGLQITINFALVWINISSRHSNLNFAHHLVIHVIYWLLQNGANKNHWSRTWEKSYMINSHFFQNW